MRRLSSTLLLFFSFFPQSLSLSSFSLDSSLSHSNEENQIERERERESDETCLNSKSGYINDPKKCRMITNSDLVYAMITDHFETGSGVEVVMKYDLELDSTMKNTINEWNGGYDIYLKTAYDYTRWGGPLGM
jgi:hypothetical protein